MMNWDDISNHAKNWMRELGNFGPTVNKPDRLIKGYSACASGDVGKTYYSSDELRELSAACLEVADWLDARAQETEK